jgi:hypothetical protein
VVAVAVEVEVAVVVLVVVVLVVVVVVVGIVVVVVVGVVVEISVAIPNILLKPTQGHGLSAQPKLSRLQPPPSCRLSTPSVVQRDLQIGRRKTVRKCVKR